MNPRRAYPYSALGILLALSLALGVARPADAVSLILEPVPPYQAEDYFTDGQRMISSFDVWGNQVAVWGSNFGEILDLGSGSVLHQLGSPASYFSQLSSQGIDVYNSFTAFDPSGSSVWVGFTTGGNVDDRVFEVTHQDGVWSWNQRATLPGNFELEFFADEPYISANPGGMNSAEAAIYRLDTSGNDQHDVVALVGGYPAGLAFDGEGNLYYGTNYLFGPPNQLIQYTADQVASAVGADPLDLADATLLADLASGAYDVEVDGQDRLLFTMNAWGGPSQVLQWNGTTGSGSNYQELAHGIGQYGNFLTFLHAAGDFTAGGLLLVADGWMAYPGLAGFGAPAGPVAIPEPATLVLLLLAAGGLGIHRLRR